MSLNDPISEVELSIRALVVRALQSAPDKVPAHVMQKLSDKVGSVTRRNPAEAAESQRGGLAATFAYSDLRDLQDTITSKPVWPEFELVFGTKEALNGRFAQLAELRNRLRHSRPLDGIVKNDGEAALLWFEQQLGGA